MTYEDLRAKVPGTVAPMSKLAQMDVQESQLEQDFAKLAFLFITDRAQQLMRYLLGFEVVEHEPDGSKAIGVFGFKVGEDYYYVPAFFITNQVRGIDMIFSKKTNMFFPLTEPWIDDIISRDAIELGDSADARSTRPDFENPNFDFVKRPNIGAGYSSKTAEAVPYEKLTAEQRKKVDDLFAQTGKKRSPQDRFDFSSKSAEYSEAEEGKSLCKAAWDAMCETTVEMLRKDAALKEAVSGFAGALAGTEFEKKAESGDLTRWLSEKGGPSAVASLFDALCTNVKFANAALTVYPNVEVLHVNRFYETARGCKKAAESKLKIKEVADKDTADQDRQRLLINGFFIDDKRDPQSLSRAYDYDHAATFTTADSVGRYDVLTSDGTTQKAWVLESIDTQNGKGGRFVLTDPVGTCKLRGTTTGEKIYIKGSRLAETDSLYDTGMPLSKMAEGYTYLLVDKSGKHCVVGFRFDSVRYTPGENTKIDGHISSCYGVDSCGDTCNPGWGPHGKRDSDFDMYKDDPYRDRKGHLLPEHSDHDYAYCHGITLTKGTGKAVKAGDRILVPSNYRAIVIDAPYDERVKYDGDKKVRDERTPDIRLGDITSLKFEMEKAAFHDLRVIKDGPEFYVQVVGFPVSKPFGYKQACMSLNGRFALPVETTEQILAKAAEAGRDGYVTHVHFGKAAQFVGAQMPMPPDQLASSDPYTGTPMYGPYEAQVTAPLYGAPPVPHGNPYGENLGGEGEMQQGMGSADINGMPGGDMGARPIDPEAMDLAAQAGQIGQRHVFDMSAIGGLAKVYDTSTLIDSYIPQFMQAIDRLGRVLFLYYWKNEDFGERYGTSETTEMEDTLRSVFKQFGDLAMTLRRKAVDID